MGKPEYGRVTLPEYGRVLLFSLVVVLSIVPRLNKFDRRRGIYDRIMKCMAEQHGAYFVSLEKFFPRTKLLLWSSKDSVHVSLCNDLADTSSSIHVIHDLQIASTKYVELRRAKVESIVSSTRESQKHLMQRREVLFLVFLFRTIVLSGTIGARGGKRNYEEHVMRGLLNNEYQVSEGWQTEEDLQEATKRKQESATGKKQHCVTCASKLLSQAKCKLPNVQQKGAGTSRGGGGEEKAAMNVDSESDLIEEARLPRQQKFAINEEERTEVRKSRTNHLYVDARSRSFPEIRSEVILSAINFLGERLQVEDDGTVKKIKTILATMSPKQIIDTSREFVCEVF
eukprot:gene5907-6593_t